MCFLSCWLLSKCVGVCDEVCLAAENDRFTGQIRDDEDRRDQTPQLK